MRNVQCSSVHTVFSVQRLLWIWIEDCFGFGSFHPSTDAKPHVRHTHTHMRIVNIAWRKRNVFYNFTNEKLITHTWENGKLLSTFHKATNNHRSYMRLLLCIKHMRFCWEWKKTQRWASTLNTKWQSSAFGYCFIIYAN